MLHRSELANEVAQHLKLSNDQREEIRYIAVHIDDLLDAHNKPWSQIQPVVIQPSVCNLLQCASIISELNHTKSTGIDYVKRKIETLGLDLNPSPLLNGSDLKQLGFQAGPLFRTILQDVRNQQLDAKLHNKVTAIDYVQNHYRP
jgi:hypothetical protein